MTVWPVTTRPPPQPPQIAATVVKSTQVGTRRIN